MTSLGKGLQYNDKLEALYLRHNHIGESGLKELVVALSNGSTSLRILDLSSNKLNDEIGVELATAADKTDNLEQLILRDNELGNEAGDALYFLAQSKKNLWKLQVDMNMIRYGTLLDIDKECKKNKRNAKTLMSHMPNFKQEISELKSFKKCFSHYEDLSAKIMNQDAVIKEGHRLIFTHEEKVHNIIQEGEHKKKSLDQERTQLNRIVAELDDELERVEVELVNKQKDWLRKIELEASLLERGKEFIEG
jgi:Ran GTPase-activating protein (RanGAP) involved in mRNA processing and transport